MPKAKTVFEPGRDIPVAEEADVCVIGGSCTGVFAAVRAARLGARVVLVEKQNAFGGVATSGLVNLWHSVYDTHDRERIIAGMSQEVLDRLARRHAVDLPKGVHGHFVLNTEELKIELDELVTESGVAPMLHALYAAPLVQEGAITCVVVETKSGRVAIRARMFIDASGDGDLACHCGVPFQCSPHMQPPTMCAKVKGMARPGVDLHGMFKQHREEFGLREDRGWNGTIPGCPDMRLLVQTHVFDTDVSDAKQLTAAEIEGRRQIRALMDMVRKYGPDDGVEPVLVALASYLGARESRRFEAEYKLTEEDLLSGRRFPDAIANGTYPVDVHDPEKGGFVFRLLDGTERRCTFEGTESGRWREPVDEDPTFYQIPFRTMVTQRVPNLIMAGRTIAADAGAFGAIRVMINLNQTGEAAGVAAALCADKGCAATALDAGALRQALKEGGSAIV